MISKISQRLTPTASALVVLSAIISLGWAVNRLSINNNPSNPVLNPRLVNTCLVSDNVGRLVSFYEPILRLKARWSGEFYAEFQTGVGVLAIFSEKAQEKYIPGSTEAAKNKSIILEFRVFGLDQEYSRLKGLVNTWVKPPTKTPWGTRSMYFRDPDGNLVDYYELPK
jgi:uncharacterized glyoxalase superfamily protein PhnB